MAGKWRQRGDTLVEVLMAMVILSIVIVGGITMMSRGIRAAQIAVEHTQVRLAMSGQTELLRYMRDGYAQDPNSTAGQAWTGLFNGTPLYADNTPSSYNTCGVTSSKTGFYLQESGPNVQVNQFNPSLTPTTAATVGKGLWVEATRSPSAVTPAYVDFQLRACWLGIGTTARQETVTVVRLYDPAH